MNVLRRSLIEIDKINELCPLLEVISKWKNKEIIIYALYTHSIYNHNEPARYIPTFSKLWLQRTRILSNTGVSEGIVALP